LGAESLLRCATAFVLLVSGTAAAQGRAAPTASKVIDVGSRKQVFIDRLFLESSQNVHLTMHRPHRDGQVLLEPDSPWEMDPKGEEQKIGIYSCVLKEDGLVRIWYDARRGVKSREIRVCYAESKDGIHFKKPKLGLHDVDGSTGNNVVLPGPRIGGAAVWIDPHAPPEHRYKTQAKVYPSQALEMHSSPDGIHWQLFAVPTMGHRDTQNIVFWDPPSSRYVMYTRQWLDLEKRDDNDKEERSSGYRTVRRIESEDLQTWKNDKIVMAPDERDHAVHRSPARKTPMDFYGGGVFVYGEADRAYLMLAQSYWSWHDWDAPGLGPATIDVQLAVSRDGVNFERVGDRRPFMGLGPEGEFDSRFVWAMPQPVRMGDELWIYYVGNNQEHGPSSRTDPVAGKLLSGIGRAVLRLDGFVSVDGDYTGGQFTTPPLRFSGNRLELNVDAAGGGSVHVELLDGSGNPIQGFTRADAVPVIGNSVRLPVRWTGSPDLRSLAGQSVRLRVSLTNASLYAFQFRQ
jgi:hypothetical protein